MVTVKVWENVHSVIFQNGNVDQCQVDSALLPYSCTATVPTLLDHNITAYSTWLDLGSGDPFFVVTDGKDELR